MVSDLKEAKALCEAMGGTYDERAVQMVLTMDRQLGHLPIDHLPGQFKSILGAIEVQVEDHGQAEPEVLRHLGQALLALAKARGLTPSVIANLEGLLSKLQRRVERHGRPQSGR